MEVSEMKKNIVAVLLEIILAFCFLLSACGTENKSSTHATSSNSSAEDVKKLSAITSTFKSLDEVEQYFKGYQIDSIEFYREDGQIIRKESYDTTSDGKLYVSYVYEYDFNNEGKVKGVREKYWSWDKYLDTEEYKYNDDGLLDTYYSYSSSGLISEEKQYGYFDDGTLAVYIDIDNDIDYDSDEITETTTWIDEYDEDGVLVRDSYISDDGDWVYWNLTEYHYDEDGRVISADEYVNEKPYGNDYYTYDQFGNLVQKTDWSGTIETYSYDENNRVIYENIVYSDGSGHTIRYQYYPMTNSVAEKEIAFHSSGETREVEYRTTQKDAKDNVILRVTIDSDGNEYVSELNTYEYYNNGNIKTKRIYVDGSWYFNREKLTNEIEYFKYSDSK